MLFGIWETAPDPAKGRVTDFGAHFYIAEVESPSDMQYLEEGMHALPAVPRAVITSFNGLKPGILLDQGFDFLLECYTGQNARATPDAQIDYAVRVLGIPRERVQPVFGPFAGATMGDFAPWATIPHSIYLAEHVYKEPT